MTTTMDKDDKEKFNKLCEQVGEVHTTIFGAQGQGGLIRDCEKTKEDVKQLKEYKWKVTGGLAVLTLLLSILFKALIK